LTNIPAQIPAPESNARQIGLPCGLLGLPEAQQRFIDVDQRILRSLCDFPMAAEDVVGGSFHQPSGHRVEVDIEHDPVQVPLLIDWFRVIAALPQCPGSANAAIEASAECSLEVVEPLRDGHRSASDGEVVVLCGALGYVELATGRCVRLGLLQFRTPHNR